MNHCKWLMIGATTPCNKSCRAEYCGYHLQSVRRGSNGPLPCIVCHAGVRGKSQLCINCGGKRYRELKRYYDKRISSAIIDPTDESVKDKIIKTPQDYIQRHMIKADNKLDK